MPEQDAVLAITAGTPDMQGVLNLVWKHLLPAMGTAPLPEDGREHRALVERLAGLRLPAQAGKRTSPIAAMVSGKVFRLPANEHDLQAIGIEFGDEGAVLLIKNTYGEQRIPCGHGTWSRGVVHVATPGRLNVAASAAWTDERTFVVQVCEYETPFVRTFTCRFDGDRLRLQHRINVSFGPTRFPEQVGRCASPAGVSAR